MRAWRYGPGFVGGLFLSDGKEQTKDVPIADLPTPPRLRIPLVQHAEPAATATVQPGDQVCAGQLLAMADAEGAIAIHAPVTGLVVSLLPVDTPYRDGVPAIELLPDAMPPAAGTGPGCEPDKRGTGVSPVSSPVENRCHTDRASPVEDRCHTAEGRFARHLRSLPGVLEPIPIGSVGPAFQPVGDRLESLSHTHQDRFLTRNLLSPAAATAGVYLNDPLPGPGDPPTDWLIVNALETELAQTVAHRTIIEQAEDVVAATNWLAEVIGARRVCVALDRRRRRAYGALRAAAANLGPTIVRLSNKYPGSLVPILVPTLTGRHVPHLGWTVDVGVCVVDVCALLHLYRGAAFGVPQTGVLITVAGEAVQRPGCYRVPLGACVADVAACVGVNGAHPDAIAGNIMSGPAVRHSAVVLTKRTPLLLFTPARGAPHPPLGCIRCGLCLDHCPVGLDPRGILDLVERGQLQGVSRFTPAACVDCGLCDYVCPSALPLMRAVQRSRKHVLGK